MGIFKKRKIQQDKSKKNWVTRGSNKACYKSLYINNSGQDKIIMGEQKLIPSDKSRNSLKHITRY